MMKSRRVPVAFQSRTGPCIPARVSTGLKIGGCAKYTWPLLSVTSSHWNLQGRAGNHDFPLPRYCMVQLAQSPSEVVLLDVVA